MRKDREKILDRLHVALKDERLSACCYRVQADETRKTGRRAIADHLDAIAGDHEKHIAIVEERIRALGGEPQEFKPPGDLIERVRNLPRENLCVALEHDLKAEDTEIETYQVLAKQTDGETSDVFEIVTAEDRAHVEWLRQELVHGLQLNVDLDESE